MTVVPSLKCINPLCWPISCPDNDPDAFIERMNAKAKELGMTNTVWNNPSGAAISQPCQRLLSGKQLSK